MPASAKPFPPLHIVIPEKRPAPRSMRRQTASCGPVCALPSDDYHLDYVLHAGIARFTGGISPTSMMLAGFDWAAHLMFSPSKQQMLHKSLWEKSVRLGRYAMEAGSNPTPLVEPSAADHRFQSGGWKNWPLNVIEQGFLLYGEWWKEATTGVRGVSQHHQDVVSFSARQVLDVFSPSNNPLTNPDILQSTYESGGRNVWDGYRNWLDDLSRANTGAQPAGAEAFEVGKNVALTPGKVVYRNDLIELIQYSPTTAKVHAEPIWIVPAWIMKYYILDLSPENSLVKYLVGKGHTVFMVSWKNPNETDRNVGMEHYLKSITCALHAVKEITQMPQVHAAGYCLGGTLLSILAAELGRGEDDSLKTITLLAAQTDFEEAGEITLFVDESQVSFLEDVMWKQGYLDKSQMAGAFQMLRSNDLIWSHLIKDYLQGKRQPMSDLMAWDADATRMPYRMHSEYLRQLFMQNDLAEGRFIVKGEAVALRDIAVPLFAVGTVRDHVAPWKSVYKIQLLADSDVTFVLTSGGHNAGIVSEPGHRGRTYQMSELPNTGRYLSPGQWQTDTPMQEGSWWEPWQAWLADHSNGLCPPPPMGNADRGFAAIDNAPGQYVLVK